MERRDRTITSSLSVKGKGIHQLVDEGFGDVGGDSYLLVDESAWLQDRLCVVRCGDIGALEEESDGNLVAPEQRFFNGGLKVCGIVGGIVFKFFDSGAEPLEGVVVVVGDTGAEDVDEGEAFVLDGSLDQLGEMFLFC